MSKVVLFLPPYEGAPLGPPAGLLAVAAPLLADGFEVCLVDAAVEPRWLERVERECADALCLGVSLLTGPMIRGAVDAARRVKRLRPEMPVVFGGWHPTLLPQQTLREPYVDAIVKHQGERSFLEICRRLEAGESLAGVAGCGWKRDGAIAIEPDRPMAPQSELPPPAYELADFDAYERAGGGRKLPYATSVGCPYACRYCTDMVFYDRRFNPLDVERTVDELVTLAERCQIDEVALLDSNFLVQTRRAVAIAQGLLERGARFRWTFQASTDLLCRMSDEDVRLLAASGVEHIGFGTESASPEVLRRMDKRHQSVEDMFEAARKCRQAGIRATYNLIFGFPGETQADRDQTVAVMGAIARRFDNVTFSPNLFTPYPGIPVWPEVEALGLRQPQSLEEWEAFSLGGAKLPWMSDDERRSLERSVRWLALANELAKQKRRSPGGWRRRLLEAARRPVTWRLEKQAFGMPLELWTYEARKRLALKRSLLTGEAI